MYKILLLTDFSTPSKHAIAFAQALFADAATDFCLLHAFPFVPEDGYSGTFLLGEQLESAEKAIKALHRSLTQQPVPNYHSYRSKMILGNPERAVEELLSQENFDLIVVGASGTGHSEFLGSVATGLIRAAKTNVLVVPNLAAIRPLEQLVLATDYGSVQDAQSFELLREVVSRKAARLTVLTIENPKEPDTKASELNRQYVLQALDTIQTETYMIHDENVEQGINDYLDTHRVDLLVMIPHHKSFLDVVLHRSISRAVAYHPRVPLLALYDSAVVDKPVKELDNLDNLPFATYL
ncbi:hypothetical protein GCM10028805_26230 [Spirosoma harenae]